MGISYGVTDVVRGPSDFDDFSSELINIPSYLINIQDMWKSLKNMKKIEICTSTCLPRSFRCSQSLLSTRDSGHLSAETPRDAIKSGLEFEIVKNEAVITVPAVVHISHLWLLVWDEVVANEDECEVNYTLVY